MVHGGLFRCSEALFGKDAEGFNQVACCYVLVSVYTFLFVISSLVPLQ